MKQPAFVLVAGLATLVFLHGQPLLAAPTEELDKAAEQLDALTKKNDSGTRIIERIAQDAGLSLDELREEKSRYYLGFGGLSAAHQIGKSAGLSVEEAVAAYRDQGRSWGALAQERNLNLGALTATLQKQKAGADKIPAARKIAAPQKISPPQKIPGVQKIPPPKKVQGAAKTPDSSSK